MKAQRGEDAGVVVTLTQAEAVVLHEALAFGPLIPELGTESYGAAVDLALARVKATGR